ncbi:MAG TPA: SDR family oxidoreductase [Candidatus Nanoarchaeia archaeon]|nr:SDR family oxidoreductase [Candidatus Nanoarchaeia archaeon]
MAKGEVVVVTGASAGLGRAIAHEFSRHGARVGLIARGKQGLRDAKRECEQLGGEAIALPADVADHDAVEQAATAVERKWGRIDVWVNNAMASVFSPVAQMRPEEYKRVTEVTYLGYVYGTMAALRRMAKRDRGHIVQVGSALAYRSIPLQSAYCGAKHAISGFTDSLRCELHHDKSNIKLAAVHMPALNTTQFNWVLNRLPRKPQPVPPIFQPEVGARAVYFAAHHDRREMWVGMPTVMAIVGQKVIPGLLDRYLGRTGYDSQQYDGLADPREPNNIWAPVAGAHRTHGDFDQRAQDHSTQLWLNINRWLALAAAAGAVAGLVGTMRTKRSPVLEEDLAA